MLLQISHPSKNCKGSLNITGSKSETNRLLLLKALFKALEIDNISNSDDSVAMTNALSTDSNYIVAPDQLLAIVTMGSAVMQCDPPCVPRM